MAMSRSRSAPPPSDSTALVPFEPPLQCVGCGRLSTEAAWGQHMVTYSNDRLTVLNRKASGSGCADCRNTAVVGFAPQVKPWPEVEQLLNSDPKKKASFAEWGLRLRGERLPKYPQSEVRHGTRAGVRWEDTYHPMSVKEFAQRYPGVVPGRVPGVRVETLADSRGETQEVVLTRPDDAPSRIVLYYESEATHHEVLLRPEHHVRQQQGSEWWSQALARVLQARPAATPPTLTELDEVVQRHVPTARPRQSARDAPQLQPQPAPSAATGAESAEDAADMLYEILVDGVDDGEDVALTATPSPPVPASIAGGAEPPHPPAGSQKTAPDGNSSRRLRQQTSDPAAPVRKQRRRSGSGRDAVSPTAAGGGGGDLSIVSLLAGTVSKPKVALYHCRQRLQSLEKSADQATILTERAELHALCCAEKLAPGSLVRLPAEEFMPSLQVVLQRVAPEQLPKVFLLGIVRRYALEVVGQSGLAKLDAERLLRTCWPWQLAGAADSRALTGAADSRALAGAADSHAHAGTHAFDPREPKLADVPGVDPSEKISWSSEFLVRDALVTIMARKASGLQDCTWQ